jgi:hypothetical protein
MRYAIIDLSTNLIVNVAEIEPGDGSTQPEGTLNFQSDTAGIGDSWDGTSIVPKPVPPREPRE